MMCVCVGCVSNSNWVVPETWVCWVHRGICMSTWETLCVRVCVCVCVCVLKSQHKQLGGCSELKSCQMCCRLLHHSPSLIFNVSIRSLLQTLCSSSPRAPVTFSSPPFPPPPPSSLSQSAICWRRKITAACPKAVTREPSCIWHSGVVRPGDGVASWLQKHGHIWKARWFCVCSSQPETVLISRGEKKHPRSVYSWINSCWSVFSKTTAE